LEQLDAVCDASIGFSVIFMGIVGFLFLTLLVRQYASASRHSRISEQELGITKWECTSTA
jgi:hypothetical protein